MREGRAQNENRGRDKQLLGVGGHEVKYSVEVRVVKDKVVWAHTG